MPRVENWASTWANHRSGSAGQNGGSLREIALTVAGELGIVGVTTLGIGLARCEKIIPINDNTWHA